MNSKIILAKGINLDRDYVNVVNYTETQMLALLQSEGHLVASANNYQFIRSDNTLSTSFTYSQCLQANYIAFQNPDYSNKWFFAWIDDVHYVGNYNTRLSFTIDSWATWFDYWSPHKCFINRQHVNVDTIGINRVPENIAINNIIQLSESTDNSLSDFYIVMETDWILAENSTGGLIGHQGDQFSGITAYNGQISGHQYILFNTGTEQANILDAYKYVLKYIIRCNLDQHLADIKNLFAIPSACIKAGDLTLNTAYVSEQIEEMKIQFYTMDYSAVPEDYDISLNKVTSYTDYTPKNNKCFCYPWNYLYVTNNCGGNNIFKYEDFYNQSTCTFNIIVALCITGSGKLAPKNYKGQSIDDDNGIVLGKYPTFSWSSDAFISWLTSQGINLINTISSAGRGNISKKDVNTNGGSSGMEGAVATGANIGFGIAGATTRAITGFYEGTLLPNIEGGTNCANVLWSAGRNKFIFRNMRASLEDLKIADDYFNRFGYAINKLETPNITGRTYWNYLEIGPYEDIGTGTVPQKHMEIINNICRKGVTIWHNHENIGNWDLANTIIT